MKSHTTHVTFHVPERMGFVNITDRVAQAVQESGIVEGLCLVNAMHITAGRGRLDFVRLWVRAAREANRRSATRPSS